MIHKKTCCVCFTPEKVHKFPQGKGLDNAERFAVWANFAALEYVLDEKKCYSLCEKHFEKRMFINTLTSRLVKPAYPTLHPPVYHGPPAMDGSPVRPTIPKSVTFETIYAWRERLLLSSSFLTESVKRRPLSYVSGSDKELKKSQDNKEQSVTHSPGVEIKSSFTDLNTEIHDNESTVNTHQRPASPSVLEPECIKSPIVIKTYCKKIKYNKQISTITNLSERVPRLPNQIVLKQVSPEFPDQILPETIPEVDSQILTEKVSEVLDKSLQEQVPKIPDNNLLEKLPYKLSDKILKEQVPRTCDNILLRQFPESSYKILPEQISELRENIPPEHFSELQANTLSEQVSELPENLLLEQVSELSTSIISSSNEDEKKLQKSEMQTFSSLIDDRIKPSVMNKISPLLCSVDRPLSPETSTTKITSTMASTYSIDSSCFSLTADDILGETETEMEPLFSDIPTYADGQPKETDLLSEAISNADISFNDEIDFCSGPKKRKNYDSILINSKLDDMSYVENLIICYY